MKKYISFVSLLAASFSFAGSFADNCPDIQTCAKNVGPLLGQKYIFDADVKGKIEVSPNVEFSTETAELLFTNALAANGFSRMPLSAPDTYQILRARDARDTAIPLAKSDHNNPPKLPNAWDLMTLQYKATHGEMVEDMARSARSFMPANSRIIPYELAGLLIVTDYAPNLKKLYDLIREMDVKPSVEMKARWMADRKAWREKLKKQEPAPLADPKKEIKKDL